MIETADLSNDLSDRIMKKVFSGEIRPGGQLVERRLAEQLGVGRLPVRETLMRMAAQGVVVGGPKGQGVRIRRYTPTEVRQAYQLRELLEGGIARAAATARTEDDLIALEMICDQMQADLEDDDAARWAELDHQFHNALAEASHQERFIHIMKALLIETHYIFFYYCLADPDALGAPREPPAAMRKRVLEEHRTAIGLLREGDAEGAERFGREHTHKPSDQVIRSLVARGLVSRR